MDMIDALWYGAVTPGEVLEKQDEKQKSLARLIERNRAELAALHPEAGPILEKLAGNQAELWQLAVLGQEYGFLAALEMTKRKARLVFHSGFRLGIQLAAEALSNPPELFEE